MNIHVQSLVENKGALSFVREAFATANHPDLIGEVRKVAGHYYKGVKDKGDDSYDSSIWEHIERVENSIGLFLGDDVTRSVRIYFKALAIGHELFDLKTPDKKSPLLEPQDLLRLGLPPEFVQDLYVMGVKPGQRYLDYVQVLGCYQAPMLLKLVADLKENKSSSRKPVPEHLQTEKFKAKKEYLYDIAEHYLSARLAGLIPQNMSVSRFVLQNKFVPQRLKNRAVLAQHSSDRQYYRMVTSIDADSGSGVAGVISLKAL